VDAESVRQVEYRDRTLLVRFDPKSVDSATKRDALVARLAKAGLSARFSDAVLNVRRGGQT
jgi:hypothetical protein